MKFQYSPGLIGYGPKGSDGSAGLTGMALYFTDYEPTVDVISIRNAITNNEVLFSKAVPGTALPSGRTYNIGDLIVTNRGYVYEIISINPGDIQITDGALSKAEYFQNSNISAQEGFERWSNIREPSTDIQYLIDNNNSLKDDYIIPTEIYGVNLKDYVRIEYTDASAFTLYSTAENATTDEDQALALIYTNEGNFRLGNMQENLRNLNLIFDVSLLRVNREHGFGINTPSNTIITNKEKNSNLLFDPNFDVSPSSFYLDPNGDNANIYWNLEDFTPDPSVKGIIVFCKKESPGYPASWKLDASVFNPMFFHDIEPSGYITISGLTIGTTYQYYMILSCNGWERRSEIIEITES